MLSCISLQHVSAGHQPIFGLAVACADWVQPCWNMLGHAALERAMKYSQNKVLMNLAIGTRTIPLDRNLTVGLIMVNPTSRSTDAFRFTSLNF